MFRDAAKEVRLHPGRFVATIVAIAISVAFMAAVSIFVTTQSNAMGKSASLVSSTADVVVQLNTPKDGATEKQVRDVVTAASGVEVVDHANELTTTLSTEHGEHFISLYALPSEGLRWAHISEGAWPTDKSQIAIGKDLAQKLQVGVGGQVQTDIGKLTVSGFTDEPSQKAFGQVFGTAYAVPEVLKVGGEATPTGTWLLRTAEGTDPATVVAALKPAMDKFAIDPDAEMYPGGPRNLVVATGEDAQKEAVRQITGEFDVMKYMLMVFSGIAALVGLIIIANTFTILLAQRRRQMGLLRAVGATGSQVRRRFLAEAVLLGIIGSALGLLLGWIVAWAGSALMGTSYWGIAIPWGDLAVEFAVGVLLTVLAAMLPALKATRVAPLEALRPVATSEEVRRASILRAVFCGLMTLGGLALCFMAIKAPVTDNALTGPLVLAVGGAMLVALGVLFGAPLYIPSVLRVLGKLVAPFGATSKLAANNAVRNPRRASATATALMLACGLIITLQVGAATAEKTMLAEIAQKYPVDITVATSRYDDVTGKPRTGRSIPQDALQVLSTLPNVREQVTITGGTVTSKPASGKGTNDQLDLVLQYSPEARKAASLPELRDDQILTNEKSGGTVTLTANGKPVTLTTVHSNAIDEGQGMVTSTTFQKVVSKPGAVVQWVQLSDKTELAGPVKKLQGLQRTHKQLSLSGSAMESATVTSILDTLLMIVQGLLGAAILIALIGVSNTLGLSVIERSRESALLRALGMQKASLRVMLLVEALLLALAGVVVGLGLGSFFGWLGIRSVLRQAEIATPIQFGINWSYTLGLIAIVVVAAALGSVLPGRRAANATPTEALAED